MNFKTEGGMTNSKDPDQTAPTDQSDLCLHCLLRHVSLNIKGKCGRVNNCAL